MIQKPFMPEEKMGRFVYLPLVQAWGLKPVILWDIPEWSVL